MHQLEKTHLFRLLDLIGMNVSENLIVIAYDAMLSALIKKNIHQLFVVVTYHFVPVTIIPVIPLPESGEIFVEPGIEVFPVALP